MSEESTTTPRTESGKDPAHTELPTVFIDMHEGGSSSSFVTLRRSPESLEKTVREEMRQDEEMATNIVFVAPLAAPLADDKARLEALERSVEAGIAETNAQRKKFGISPLPEEEVKAVKSLARAGFDEGLAAYGGRGRDEDTHFRTGAGVVVVMRQDLAVKDDIFLAAPQTRATEEVKQQNAEVLRNSRFVALHELTQNADLRIMPRRMLRGPESRAFRCGISA